MRVRLLFYEKVVITIDKIPNLPDEEWRPIEGYDGKYLISNCGRVKSLKHYDARLLKAFANNKGYLRVCLSHKGKGRHFLVSRLVASAFCENDDPQHKTTIDHIDGDKRNNRASNLCWMTLKDNVKKEWSQNDRNGKNENDTTT